MKPIIFLFAGLMFLCVPPLKAESEEYEDSLSKKTLFVDGVYAASYGDIGLQKTKFGEYEFVSVIGNAGWQLLRFYPLVVTVGLGVMGAGKTERHTGGEDPPEVLTYGYWGPTTEWFLFPKARVHCSISALLKGKGRNWYQKTKEDVKQTIKVKDTQRVALNIAVIITRQIHAVVSVAQESLTLSGYFPEENVEKTKETNLAYALSIRGTML